MIDDAITDTDVIYAIFDVDAVNLGVAADTRTLVSVGFVVKEPLTVIEVLGDTMPPG